MDGLDLDAGVSLLELSLAQGKPDETLRWVQHLLVPQYAGRGNAAALHLKGEALAALDRSKEAEEALQEAGFWAAQVQALSNAGKEGYVYFNNDWEGFAIRDATALQELLGMTR